jgi:RHS repeat-associated protein
VGGQKLVEYTVTSLSPLTFGTGSENVYFGGKLIRAGDKAILTDRLGSVMSRVNAIYQMETHDYFPYGEEMVGTANNRDKFGTYSRDAASGLDYADQRYYAGRFGRFRTADESGLNESFESSASFNRYLYVEGDPVNFNDPEGEFTCGQFQDPGRNNQTISSTLTNDGTGLGHLTVLVWHEAGIIRIPSGTAHPLDFVNEQRRVATAVMNRFDIANKRIKIYNGGKEVAAAYGGLGKDLRSIVLEAGGMGKSWGIFDQNGQIANHPERNDNARANLLALLGTDVSIGPQVQLSTLGITIEGGPLTVNQNCASLLSAYFVAKAAIGGSRWNPNGVVLTSWNRSPRAEGGEPISLGFLYQYGNSWHGFQSTPSTRTAFTPATRSEASSSGSRPW